MRHDQSRRYITLRYVTLRYVTLRLHYVTLRHITLHYVTLRYITLHHVTLRYITLHYVTLRYITLRHITLHYVTLRYITLHYVTLHYITLHYITLHCDYITLHCITSHQTGDYDARHTTWKYRYLGWNELVSVVYTLCAHISHRCAVRCWDDPRRICCSDIIFCTKDDTGVTIIPVKIRLKPPPLRGYSAGADRPPALPVWWDAMGRMEDDG